MEIKSSLLNSDSFKHVKDSIINISKIDGKEKFRVNTIEYINDTSDNNDDEFFYDMLEFVRFLDPSSDSIAYTTPEHLIFLNCPGNVIGENFRQWDFTYCHECLHQLWDTFGVADRIKKEQGTYNHQVLNIASDCVINDYLSFYRKKSMPDGLITPEYLKEEFDVTYDRKKDTQYTLYLKLMKKADQLMNDKRIQDALNDMDNSGDSGSGSGEGNGSSSSSGSAGQSGSQQGNSNKNETASEAADRAKKAAEQAQDAADNASGSGSSDKAKEAQDAADKANTYAKEAQDAADKAKEAQDAGDKKGVEKATKEAQDAADKAEAAAKKAQGEGDGKKDGDDKDKTGDKKGNTGKQAGKGHIEGQESDEDLSSIKKTAETIINKYKNKLSGDLSEFVKKCKVSQELKESGLSTNAQKASVGWNQKLNSSINAFVKKRVFQKKREYQNTYSRVKRGSGFIKYGEPIMPGKKLREQKLTINVAFYVDRSGSMSSSIDNVFKSAYTIAESLKKQFSKEKVVDDITFKMYTFDDVMKEIPFGKKTSVGGGTMPFHEILKFIKENTYNYLINVIITDAQFEIKESEIDKFIKDIDGIIEFVTNEQNSTIEKLSNKYKTQLNYIEADETFTIK